MPVHVVPVCPVRWRRPGAFGALLLAAALVRPPVAAGLQDELRTRCSEGIVTSIELDRRPVYDPSSTSFGPLSWAYRVLNVLHAETTPSFIRRELLFEEGDCYDPFLVSESVRLLDQYSFLAYAEANVEDDGAGGRQVMVATRDEWSTQLDLGVTYDQGPKLETLEISEENFLGQGVFAEFTHQARREINIQAFRVVTPRLFGRTDASVGLGRTRPGHVFNQFVRYPFIGETGSLAVRQGYERGTDYFSYATGGAEAFSQVLVPAYRELTEFSFARRVGEPNRAWIAGVSFTRDIVDFEGGPVIATDDDFDDLQPLTGPTPPQMTRQLLPAASTRVGLQLGTRRFRYAEYFGLDGVRDRQLVSLGVLAGLTVGRGFAVLAPASLRKVSDSFGRFHLTFGAAVGSSFLHGAGTVEARRDGGAWNDVLADADLVGYLRTAALPGNTVFFRASFAGGWDTTLPFQLRLGGREVVRSLAEDRYPGGRMMRFVLEDRVVLPWPEPGGVDLGLTVFSDLGRMWRGDVPYGVDSGWQAGVGFGFRVGIPGGTRTILRPDIVFPIGATSGDPVFRVVFEFNRLRDGYFTKDVFRSRRLNLGPDHFAQVGGN